MDSNKIKQDLCICLPTCRDSEESSYLDSTLSSIATQTILPHAIYLRDEGKFECFKKHSTRMLWNLLSSFGIKTVYLRTNVRNGVAYARRELSENLKDEQYILWIDDDIVIQYNGFEKLLNAIEKDMSIGFVQGQKIEMNPLRSYDNDINKLNGANCDTNSDKPFNIYFGDAAFLMVRKEAMESVDWNVVTKYCSEGLAGEDVAMTLMIADKHPCYGVPDAIAWHISPEKERWRWEISSDILQSELLKGIVSEDTIIKALPHLKKLFIS